MSTIAAITAALLAAGVPADQASAPAGFLEDTLAVTPSCEEMILQRVAPTPNAPYGGVEISAPNPKASGSLPAALWVAPRRDFTMDEVQAVVAGYGVCQLQGVNLYAGGMLYTHEDAQKLTAPLSSFDPTQALLYAGAGAAGVYAAVIAWTSRRPQRDPITDEIQELLRHG